MNGIKSSRYRGVSWHKVHRKWLATTRDPKSPTVNKTRFIGLFATELEAAQAYNEATLEIRGSEAVLNKLPDDPPPPSDDEIWERAAASRSEWSAGEWAERAPHLAPVAFRVPLYNLSDLVIPND